MGVEAFRAGRLRFDRIVPTIAAVLTEHDVPSDGAPLTVDDVLAADAWARRRAAELVAAESEEGAAVDSLLWTAGALLFVLAILASIGLHELGHMIPAKKFGGKVTQYFVGFGPTVWSTRRGETEYGVKAIPLGGYVKIVGMLPPGAAELADEVTVDAAGNTVTKVRKSNTGMFTQLISDARAAEWELVGPEDSDRLFYKMPWWKKVVVMAGGPTVNILIAFFVFWAIFATLRQPDRARSTPAARSSPRSPTASSPTRSSGRACTDADPLSPAAEAGLQPGRRDHQLQRHRRSPTGTSCAS